MALKGKAVVAVVVVKSGGGGGREHMFAAELCMIKHDDYGDLLGAMALLLGWLRWQQLIKTE
jgi:hypothetical protein